MTFGFKDVPNPDGKMFKKLLENKELEAINEGSLNIEFTDSPEPLAFFRSWLDLLAVKPESEKFDFEIEGTTFIDCTQGPIELIEGPSTLTFQTTITYKGTK